mgnify:CR=1 FL=1
MIVREETCTVTDSKQEPPRLRQVQCADAKGLHRMAYWEWGDAANPRVLVCVHGLSRQGRDFDVLARAMAGEYRVVCPDVVGRGRSDWLADPMGYNVPAYVADMVTLLARLDAEVVHWVGTSMGGLIGMGLASLPGTPISRLVLNDVGPVIEWQSLQRIGLCIGSYHGHASQHLGMILQRTQHQLVVHAQKAGLHPNTARHTRALRKRLPVRQSSGVLRHITRTGHSLARMEHMEVGVYPIF